MPRTRANSYRPSLRRWSGALALAWLIGVGVLAPVSVHLFDQIYDDAQTTYKEQIPSLLDKNRNAIKLERLASLMRMVGSATDPNVERRVSLQLQTLSQGFDFDDDARLNAGASKAAASARRIVALHETIRRLARSPGTGSEADRAAESLAAETLAHQICDEEVQALGSLTDYVSTDAALIADSLANRIQANASWVKHASLTMLGSFVVFGIVLLWAFQRHVLQPIAIAIRGLEEARASHGTALELPRALFSELDVIGRSVEQYARFTADLRVANLALKTLSHQDGLTGLANRRSFDAELEAACDRAAKGTTGQALLLIDIDHFKALNDRCGHLAGDQCLRQVASILQDFCDRNGHQASRYGGEEFAVILRDASLVPAREAAERLRSQVEHARLQVSPGARPIGVTISVGVASIEARCGDRPDLVIEAADAALYRAKRGGRNRVCVSGAHEATAFQPSSAA